MAEGNQEDTQVGSIPIERTSREKIRYETGNILRNKGYSDYFSQAFPQAFSFDLSSYRKFYKRDDQQWVHKRAIDIIEVEIDPAELEVLEDSLVNVDPTLRQAAQDNIVARYLLLRYEMAQAAPFESHKNVYFAQRNPDIVKILAQAAIDLETQGAAVRLCLDPPTDPNQLDNLKDDAKLNALIISRKVVNQLPDRSSLR